MVKDDINTRFIEAVNFLISEKTALSKGEIAEKFGIKPPKFSEILNNRMKAGTDLIAKICNEYKISPDWLLTGRGPMLRSDNDINIGRIEPSEQGIPLIPIDAIAGFPSIDIDSIKYEDCQHYQVPEFSSKGVEFLIRVSGSSMYPKYSNGDLLACKKIPEILFFQWGKVYVIDSSQGALVKRIFEDKEDYESIICVSDNTEKYPPFKLPKSDIRSLSIVIGVIRME